MMVRFQAQLPILLITLKCYPLESSVRVAIDGDSSKSMACSTVKFTGATGAK